MERWVIVLFVVALFLGVAVMGLRYRRQIPATAAMCSTAEAQCGDRPYPDGP